MNFIPFRRPGHSLRPASWACAALTGTLLGVSAHAAPPSQESAGTLRLRPPAKDAASKPAASQVPVLAPDTYAVAADELIDLKRLAPDAAQDGGTGQPFAIKSDTVQKFGPQAFVAGRTYRLKIKARPSGSDKPAVVAVRFRRTDKSELYRSYETRLQASDNAEREITFTAPSYVGMAELAIATNGNLLAVESLSLKMQEPAAQTEPVASLEGSYVPAGYKLAFNDEFNGTALNRNKWFTRYIYEGGQLDHLGKERQRYRDNDNHQVANGVLSLVARKAKSGPDYDSAVIRSDWTTRYGYFEARVKMPPGKGVFPAFWLNPDVENDGSMQWPPEIDIFEMVNDGANDKTNVLHTGVIQKQPGKNIRILYQDPAFDRKWSFWRAPFHFNEGWHTIGSEWTPDSVTTYVDGKKIVSFGFDWNYNNGKIAGPAHILLNLAIGGDWAGRNGIDESAFPQALQVDWVRAYKKAD
jgi:beta-glucanase (GH16 family)